MSLFCCDIFSTDSYIISDIFRMSSIIFAFFSELKGNMTLRERVKILCKEQKTSLNALETECGFAKGYASKLDKSTPNAENLRKIADFFHVSVDYLMTGKEPEQDFSDESAHLIAQIRKDTELSDALKKYFGLSDAKKKHIVELINLLSE
jgi:transcriptional regulator with XRE-family HTH domain